MKILSGFLMAIVALQASAAAQAISPADWENLRSIAPGQQLLVKTKDGRDIKGSLLSVTDSILEISVRGRPSALQPETVAKVYVLLKRSRVKTTLIGLAAGAGGGAAIGAADGGSWIFSRGQVAAMMAGAGAVIGSVAGLVIGSATKRKELVYDATRR